MVIIMLFIISSCNSNPKNNKDESSPEKSSEKNVEDNKDKEKEEEKDENDGPFKNGDKKRVKAKALYLTANSASAKLDHYIELANETEINAYVVDYKDDYGIVFADTEVELAKEIGANEETYKSKELTKKLRDNDIYSIARIVCFKDPILAREKTDTAIKSVNGGLYRHNNMYWLDPNLKKNWDYNIDLAKEALANGFDEVQFDYIRFPDGKKSEMDFGENNGKIMHEVINEFLAYARSEMPDQIISGDVFAIICESPNDTEKIGQDFELIGENLDYICPMAYPSHYARGQIINKVKFPNPDLDPYNLIKNTFLKAKARLEQSKVHKPILRPYLQDFTASWLPSGTWQDYGAKQVREEIQGLYDAGYEEWILWDFMNTYSEGAFEKE